jgi:Adenylate and Guanylate cyclase catalytic domain
MVVPLLSAKRLKLANIIVSQEISTTKKGMGMAIPLPRTEVSASFRDLERCLLPWIAKLGFTPAVQPVRIAEESSEYHHVTVMMCDLVDTTDMATRFDAEEWRDLVDAHLDAVSAAVTEMGGKLAKKFDDGLMAPFGYPAARENDSERAVRAALAAQPHMLG